MHPAEPGLPRLTQFGDDAVLVIDVPDDHYVLDNRFAVIVPVFHLIGNGYTLESIQAVGGSHEWIKWKHA